MGPRPAGGRRRGGAPAGSGADPDQLDYVLSNHEHGTFQAVRHLVGLGHRRIALFTRATPSSAPIAAAFEAVAADLDLPADTPRVVAGAARGGPTWPVSGRPSARRGRPRRWSTPTRRPSRSCGAPARTV
ncbi:hypothetical protein NKH77_44595 [Streptomyces sp. M19]